MASRSSSSQSGVRAGVRSPLISPARNRKGREGDLRGAGGVIRRRSHKAGQGQAPGAARAG